MKDKNFINPLFESLKEQAKKSQRIPEFFIYEQEEKWMEANEQVGPSMSDKDAEEYLKMIIKGIWDKLVYYIMYIPDKKLHDELTDVNLLELSKMTNNDKIDNLTKGLFDKWEIVYNKTKITEFSDIYEKANEGFAAYKEALEALKGKAEKFLGTVELLSSINTQMSDLSGQLRKTVEELKAKNDKAKAEAASSEGKA